MRRFFLISAIPLFLMGCQLIAPAGQPFDATGSEIRMAEMMGITVGELRSQTPQEHMQMMQNMMHDAEPLTGETVDVESLPIAKDSEQVLLKNGDTYELVPTAVRKQIAGVWQKMYGYNGQIPGPLLQVHMGDTVTITVRNDIDQETTVHWHGLRLSNANDGVPGVTQKEAIQPNGTFVYTVAFPDEGVYWYHPHVREDLQQDLGLYGNIVVLPNVDNAYSPANEEYALVLDDMLLDRDGRIVPYGKNNENYSLMGRFGNALLINGVPIGVGTDQDPPPTFTVPNKSVVRLYITNTANTRTFRIQKNASDSSMKLVGGDVGRLQKERFVDSITLAPAERAIVDIYVEDRGGAGFGASIVHSVPAGASSRFNNVSLLEILTSDVSAEPSYVAQFEQEKSHTDVIADIDTYRPFFDKPVDKTLHLSVEFTGGMGMMDHSMMMGDHAEDGIEWEDSMPMMNEQMTSDMVEWKLIDADTKKENMDIHWQFKKGDIAKIRIINDEEGSDHPMQHPIHFHGQRFLVLSIDGVPNKDLSWKDTVLVPTGSTADILMDFSNPGDWMFHCHIAEHLTNGMMGMFTVSD